MCVGGRGRGIGRHPPLFLGLSSYLDQAIYLEPGKGYAVGTQKIPAESMSDPLSPHSCPGHLASPQDPSMG